MNIRLCTVPFLTSAWILFFPLGAKAQDAKSRMDIYGESVHRGMMIDALQMKAKYGPMMGILEKPSYTQGQFRVVTPSLEFVPALDPQPSKAAAATPWLAQPEDRTLHEAVRAGDIAKVKKLLDVGADVNATVENHMTPIFFASDPQVVDLLLAHKPKLNIRDAASIQSPLERAAMQFYEDPAKADVWRTIVDKLRQAGGEYTIDAATYMNDVASVRQMLEKDDSWVNRCRGAQSVPLRIAARTGRAEICRLLLQHKADPNDFEKGIGYPILVDAVAHPAVVKLLIDAGANLRRRITWLGFDRGPWPIGAEATALHFAASKGNIESVRLLVQAGIDVNAAAADGQTPLHIALCYERAVGHDDLQRSREFLAVIRFLLDHEASLRFPDKQDETPLQLAARIHSPKEIQELLAQREREMWKRHTAAMAEEKP